MVRPLVSLRVIETESAKRIELQPVFLDRIATGLAEAISLELYFAESSIHLCEELVEIVI
jgi:hypothetical protein